VADDDTAEIDEPASHFYLKTGLDAAQHLIAVAASLDSMVVGETEVLGQVKQAHMIASREQASGKILHALFQTAFRCAKRVHSETDISRGRVSVSSVAVEFAEKIFDELGEKTIMVVGAGQTAELALRSLVERGVTSVLVLNRSFHRGKALAEQCGGQAVLFELLAGHLPRADIVISSTGAPHCVIHTATVQQAVRARRGRPILLIDIAVPRDIEEGAGRLKDVYLYHIDDLQRVADANLAKRGEAVEKAWQIVREETAEVSAAYEDTDLRALMLQFDRQAREIKEAQLKRAFARQKMAALPEECREEIDTLVQKTINKTLAAPRKALNRAARNGRWQEYARVARDLFGLEKEHDDRNL